MKHTLAIVIAAVLCLAVRAAVADEVVLKDGRKFTGEVQKDTADVVVIRTVGGTLEFRRSEVLQVVMRTEPKKIYRQRSEALSAKAVTERLELARWCVAQGLEAEARREVEMVLLADPQNFDAQNLLTRLARAAAIEIPLRVEVTLTDGSQVKGRLLNPVFTIETPYGLLHVPTRTITVVTIGEDKNPDVIETPTYKTRGQLAEDVFVVDSKLGRLSIARKDVRELTIAMPSDAEMAELAFNDTMRQYGHLGLDVVLVVDGTESMAGALLRLRQEAPRLIDTIRRFVPNAQFGLVAYRDHKVYDPAEFTWVTQTTPLAEKPGEFLKALVSLRAACGGDIPDAVFDGLSEAMTNAGWRAQSHRVVVLIGDAPPHIENQGVKKTLTLVGDWHRNTQGIVHTVDATGYGRLMEEFRLIAEAGGGKSLALADDGAKDLVRELLPIILGQDWRDRLLKAWDEAAPPAKAAN